MGTCSICNKDKKLTNEHIWSDCVLRVFDEFAPITFDNLRGRVHLADPTIKDICKDCNENLSVCDDYVGTLSRKFIKKPISNEIIEIDRQLLLRWVIKTAANHSRAIKEKIEWWKKHIEFIQHGNNTPDVDLFFATWDDVRTHDMSVMMPIHPLEAKNVSLDAIQNPTWDDISRYYICGWALKVGHAIFTLLNWSDDTPKELREDLEETLNYYGWQSINNKIIFGIVPFNEITCFFYNIISNPSDLSGISSLIAKSR